MHYDVMICTHSDIIVTSPWTSLATQLLIVMSQVMEHKSNNIQKVVPTGVISNRDLFRRFCSKQAIVWQNMDFFL